jgi:uncharacterized membrane protein (DUF4010 family)
MIRTGALLGVTIAGMAFATLPEPKAAALTAIALFAYTAVCVLLRADRNENGRARMTPTSR